MTNSRFSLIGIIGGVFIVTSLALILILDTSRAASGQQGEPKGRQGESKGRQGESKGRQGESKGRQVSSIEPKVQEGKRKAVKPSASKAVDSAPATVEEARIRARILHESFAGSLQVMHRDFFREGERLKLPSQSLEDVFKEMAKTHQVNLRWLAVDANAMNVNHKPQNKFEEQVVKELSTGKNEFELANEKSFQYAGSIRLSASCVKCHVRGRTSNAEKKAALVITMPLRK